jgi:hypothetical protein
VFAEGDVEAISRDPRVKAVYLGEGLVGEGGPGAGQVGEGDLGGGSAHG